MQERMHMKTFGGSSWKNLIQLFIIN
jgi:hypothetical protein